MLVVSGDHTVNMAQVQYFCYKEERPAKEDATKIIPDKIFFYFFVGDKPFVLKFANKGDAKKHYEGIVEAFNRGDEVYKIED